MNDWQRRRDHDRDIHEILLKNKAYAPHTKQIIKWAGPHITADMISKGHTSLDFKVCKCKDLTYGNKSESTMRGM